MRILELYVADKGPWQGCRLRDCEAEPSRHAEEVHPARIELATFSVLD